MNLLRFKNLLKKNFESGFSFFFILSLIFIFGIIVGALFIKALDPKSKLLLLKMSSPYFYNVINKTYSNINVFKASLFSNFLFVILTYFIGLSNFGIIISPILLFIKGSLLGYNVGYLINEFSTRGFFASVFGVYPQYLLYIPALISISALSIIMSYRYKLTSSRRIVKPKKLELTDYSTMFLFFLVILIIGSLYESFISPIFLNLINEFL